MTIKLDNVVALVTGAAGGIGRGMCQAMKDAGAQVIATDLGTDPGNLAADLYCAHDVTDPAAWAEVSTLIDEKFGRLDALVNNAGMTVVESIEAQDLESWRHIHAVNVESILLGTQAMLPLLKLGGKARKSGAAIVNTCSIAGLGGAAFNAAYCATKGAVNTFSKSAAIEFAALGYNIRVNTIHPGGVETAMLDKIMQRYVELGMIGSIEEGRADVNRSHPLGRVAQPEEIAGGVVYLCSAAASFVTGSSLGIDGGFMAS